MERRTFLKMAGVGLTTLAAGNAVPGVSHAAKEDIGEIRSLKVTVLSETSWFNNDIFKKNMMDGGGAMGNQYDTAWDRDNSGGYSALLEIEQLDGKKKKILMDTGWNNDWMDYVYKMHGIDQMLRKKEIDTMVLSHWHLDHFWGIESTLKHNPNITLYAPSTHYPEDIKLLKGGSFEKAGCKNSVPHKGQLVECTPDKVVKLMPGAAVKMFDVPIILRVRGESVLYFHIKDKGIVTVTGCCHPGILTLYSFARNNFAKGDEVYGSYGGLHISLFETWDPKYDDIIKGLKTFKPGKFACNHCTGWIFAEKAAAAGLPVVKGTDKYKSYKKYSTVAKATNVYLTNGDTVTF
ncbi:MAG: MBL fold metallo-hydrolase [Alphaproteobacteria bacterium]|uniref:MBL fold metallo-hydrolase n=1 Tax=Candidatus Nitrobium versatile TaxID=2884831 RepID=A0A953J7V1_9BACT|nr:MBL fold metallo-hydrolase [Candidatus Nitrobium versatile]